MLVDYLNLEALRQTDAGEVCRFDADVHSNSLNRRPSSRSGGYLLDKTLKKNPFFMIILQRQESTCDW